MEKKKRKKKVKKLSLTKETLRGLDYQEMKKAAGAAPTITCANSGCRSCHTCFCP